jgi:2-C-methyl-D-erythritol 2,4-cyclodiphosphate synthase
VSNGTWPRTGIGYDVHRFAEGRPLVLGGVRIPHVLGLDGHSDADVLLHAIADALLGAAALGDIGQHFPPSDERWRGIDSREILRHAVKLLGERGWNVINIDATVIAEAPKIMPHAAAMRETIAEAAGIDVDAVSIKATTNETLGFVGRGEGIAAIATATIAPATDAP